MTDSPSSSVPAGSPANAGRLLAYLRLFRLPNVFTAMADIAMGFLFVNTGLAPLGSFCGLLLASCLLYTAGMVLNDVYDLEVDARERPRRPLPSGQIDWWWARTLGFLLLLGGVSAAWATGWADPRDDVWSWRSGAVASGLGACVWLYDAALKKTPLAPLAMGACRFFNVLLGMSLAPEAARVDSLVLGYDGPQLCVAAGIAVYIVGVTWFARTEATESRRGPLSGALATMALGLGFLAFFPDASRTGFRLQLREVFLWPVVVALLGMSIVRRCVSAIVEPTPQTVQAAVKHCIFSLVVLDAAVCLAVRGPGPAVGILLLAVPMHLLGRWVYST